MRTIDNPTADALQVAAEELVTTARAASARLGIPDRAGALAVLGHAYAMAIADHGDDVATVFRSIDLARELLPPTVLAYRQRRGAVIRPRADPTA